MLIPPAILVPSQVGNQREVERWLDVMVFHGGVAPRPPSGKAMAGGERAAGVGGPALQRRPGLLRMHSAAVCCVQCLQGSDPACGA